MLGESPSYFVAFICGEDVADDILSILAKMMNKHILAERMLPTTCRNSNVSHIKMTASPLPSKYRYT